MARILLATIGSLGDLHPALALALELRRRGHRAEIATSEFYREKITGLGLPFHPLPPDVAVGDGETVRRIMDGRDASAYLLRDLLFPSVPAMFAALVAAAEGIDLLVSSEIVYAAPLLAGKTGLRWVSYSLAPISLFSVHDPSLLPGPPGTHLLQRLGPRANRFLRRMAGLTTYRWWRPVRALRRDLRLPPGRSPLFEGKFSPALDLALFSPVLQPPQPDWPVQTVQCGFPFYDEGEGASAAGLPAAVKDFLAAGAPPVVFTLGSAAVFAADNFFAEGARAAHRLGHRGLLLLGQNPPPPDLPPTVRTWDYLPYAQIFPHAAAIVHQGGVGTTAQALRAGRPMLVVPFAHDQPDNAARVTRLGVARTLARSRYRASRVARELALLLGDPAVALRAAAAGERIRAEHGVVSACNALETTLVG
ncbi:MAG: glycosyltransferase [Verrucomicrobiota bacterium]